MYALRTRSPDPTGGKQLQEIVATLEAVRERQPIVHNITNLVVMNFTANALLAVGARPVMAHALEEVEEMAAMADAVVLNLGTLSAVWIEAMFRAARVARQARKPVILDPVGAGATRLRTETAKRLLDERLVTLVRGNASEILALAGRPAQTRGVDSGDLAADAREAAIGLSRMQHAHVAMTGAEDTVTDGERVCAIRNGHALMSRVTGTGCAASALTAAFCAVERDEHLAATAALVTWGIAGELAARGQPGAGSYATLLLDALDQIGAAQLYERARMISEYRAF